MIFVNRYYDPDISATSQLLTDLARDQAARGREVHVITSRQRYEDSTAFLPAEERIAGVFIHRLPTTRFGRHRLTGRAADYLTFHLSAAARLLALAREGDVVVAKTDPPLISVVAAWAAARRRARLVNWLQDVFPEVATRLGVRAFNGMAGRLATALRDYSLRQAAANVAVGRLMAERISSRLPQQAPRCAVIENWSDGAIVFPVEHDRNPLRQRWELQSLFVVSYSGNMGRAHEFATILEACQLLREERSIVFLFIGDGRQRRAIEAEATRRGLTNVRFEPYQPRESLSLSLSAADVHLVTLQPDLEGLIVPSKYYGIAAAGRASILIGDPRGEIARMVDEEGSGVAVRTGDALGLASAIRAYRNDPELCRAIGRRAREEFQHRHDRPKALAAWDEILSSLPRE